MEVLVVENDAQLVEGITAQSGVDLLARVRKRFPRYGVRQHDERQSKQQ